MTNQQPSAADAALLPLDLAPSLDSFHRRLHRSGRYLVVLPAQRPPRLAC